jgi:inorganic triphosphatase YgiF
LFEDKKDEKTTMEIEKKFRIEQDESFATLAELTTLGAYTLHHRDHVEQQHNTYYDTTDRQLEQQRYGLRIRQVDGRSIATLKGAGEEENGMFRRDEWELEAADPHPATWSEGEARAQGLSLLGEAPLVPLLTIHTQRRHIIAVRTDQPEQEIAELSLDEGIIEAGGRSQPLRELEIEMLPAGTEDDLEALEEALREYIALVPEPQTKLGRGMKLLHAARDTFSNKQRKALGESIDELLARHHASHAHAYHVADLALALFNLAGPIHEINSKKRSLLRMGALLHDVGTTVDEANHHLAGRDIILDELPWKDTSERAVVACLAAFHRKKVRPDLEPAYLFLGKKDRHTALTLAALLRVADGLDYTHTQSTLIRASERDGSDMALYVTGAHSAENSDRARKKASLWRKHLHGKLRIVPDADGDAAEEDTTEPESDKPESRSKLAARTATSSYEPVALVGRRLLRGLFQRMLIEEQGVRNNGEEIEPVHQMRVAIRRMRAVLQLIGNVVPAKPARRFRKELQRVAKALSPVRDADVFLEHLGQYVEHVADEDRSGMAVLSGTLQRERVEARYELLAFLESERYADFKREFAAFLVGDPVGWDMTPRVRDLVGGMLWRRYEKLRAYELHITFEGELDDQQEDALHQMRIAGKHLRYVLDTFSGTFADHADQCIEPLKELQDHLDETFDQMPFCVPVPINSRLAPSDWDGAE